MLDEEYGADAASETLVVDASWLDATGVDAGVACNRGSLVAAHFVTPAGGAFGAASVVDSDGAVAPHVVIEPDGAKASSGETDTPGSEVPGDGPSATGAGPATGGPAAKPGSNPVLKPAAVTTKTTTNVTKTTAARAPKPKTAALTGSILPKTADTNWIAASATLFLLGTALLNAAHRC